MQSRIRPAPAARDKIKDKVLRDKATREQPKKNRAVPNALQIGGVSVSPGERTTIGLPLARLYTYADMHMPVHVIHSKRAGPTLFVCAAVHGDELNGVEIIRRLLEMKLLSRLRGTLIAVPVVNVYGFVNRTRYLPDRRDLNRSFPGSAKGSLASQIANLVMDELIVHATHGIDLHTGSNNRDNLPQIRACLDSEETARLAHAFGAPVILDANLRDGSLREAVHAQGVPMLLYEAGEALRFDESMIRVGLRGILNVMRSIGQLPARKSGMEADGAVGPLVAKSTKWIRAPKSGMIHSGIRLGASVQKGDVLSQISDPSGENSEAILSSTSGIVIGSSKLPLVHRGDALFHIARFEDSGPAEPVLDTYEDWLDVADFDPLQ